MISAVATALLLLAAAPTGADLSWLIDAEIPARIAAAQVEAARLDGTAAESDRLQKEVLSKRQAALVEKATLEVTLPSLSRGKQTDAAIRIAELGAAAEGHAVRAKQLAAEATARRSGAQARRAFAIALDTEGKARRADDATFGVEPDADLAPLSDVRLAEVTAYLRRRMARLPKQLAALDEELDLAATPAARGEVVTRKEALRAAAAVDDAQVLRIAEELRFRTDSRSEEALLAKQMEDAGKAKAAERASVTPSPTATGGKDPVDLALDRVLAEQDRQAAASASRSKTLRTVTRIAAAAAGIGALGAILVFVLRRMG